MFLFFLSLLYENYTSILNVATRDFMAFVIGQGSCQPALILGLWLQTDSRPWPLWQGRRLLVAVEGQTTREWQSPLVRMLDLFVWIVFEISSSYMSLCQTGHARIKCIFVCFSPTVIRFTMKRLNRTHSRSQWLIVIPVHCGSAVADPSGLTPRLEESQLQGPQWIYSHYNNCKYLSFMSSLHLNEPFHAVVSMQQLVWPSDAGMTRCWQTCVTVVKRVSYPAHQTRGQSWDC